jgi:pyruvate/2-oxoglutarate dehydrogenase complex dihydrolipoamide dehydrogenase (E3) component
MSYDVIIIGAGPVGENVADRAALGGLKVAIIESELVGGECSFWACMPSKALLRPGIALRAAQGISGAKQAVTPGAIGVQEVLKRRNYITGDWSDKGGEGWLKSAGITLIRGRGEITGKKTVKVVSKDGGKEEELEAKHAVVVSTGSDAMIPENIKGIKDVKPWTSREATSAQEVPPSLVVIGGGVVACEMATAWSTLGSKVTLTSRGKLLSGVEAFAGEMVAESLKKMGVDVRLGVSPVSVGRSGKGGDIVVQFNDQSTVTASEILVATGRTPRTKNIGLETIGLQDGKWIPVDDTLLVKHSTNSPSDPWLYATGDVNHRALLTHQGKYQGRACGDIIVSRSKNQTLSTDSWGMHVATADHESVPQVIFTDPEVAAVGLTEAAAKKKGYQIKCVEYDMANVAGAYLHADEYIGKAKMVVDTQSEVVLGVTFVGQDVAELLQAATIAVVGEVSIQRLWHAVPAYPTISEIWLRLLEAYGR